MKVSVKRRACILGKFFTVVASMDLNAKFLHFFQVAYSVADAKRFDLDPNSKLPSFLGNLDSINNMKKLDFFPRKLSQLRFYCKITQQSLDPASDPRKTVGLNSIHLACLNLLKKSP